MTVLGVLAALLVACLLSTTAESRAEMKPAVDRFARWLIIPTIFLAGIIAWPFVQRWLETRGQP
jgi:hypothetical protein